MHVNAAIKKSDIAKCADCVGMTNAKPFLDAPAGALVYVTFAGALNLATKLYEGVHVFRGAKPADDGVPLFDFNKLPGVSKCP